MSHMEIRLLPHDWQSRAPWYAKEARRAFMREAVRVLRADHLARTSRLPAIDGRIRLAEATNELAERDKRRPRKVVAA